MEGTILQTNIIFFLNTQIQAKCLNELGVRDSNTSQVKKKAFSEIMHLSKCVIYCSLITALPKKKSNKYLHEDHVVANTFMPAAK